MSTKAVEKVIQMRQGPPWGFRLSDTFNGTLVVSQVRRQSPADVAGLRENDVVLALNNYPTRGLNRSYAIEIINSSKFELDLVVQRQERRKPQMMTFFLDTSAARGQLVRQETASRDLDISWRKKPSPPPPPPEPPRIQPMDPNITPVSLDRLLKEYDSPKTTPPAKKKSKPQKLKFTTKSLVKKIKEPVKETGIYNREHENSQSHTDSSRNYNAQLPSSAQNLTENANHYENSQEGYPRRGSELIRPYDTSTTPVSMERLMKEYTPPDLSTTRKKRTFANSAFYGGPNVYYPSVEEQIEMARRVAKSIEAPINQGSRGARMFESQQQRVEKYVKEGPEPIPDPIENSSFSSLITPTSSLLRGDANEQQATAQQLEYMIPPVPPPPAPPPPPSYPTLTSSAPPPPPAPPPRPGQPRSIQEFIEKMQLFPKNTHTEISPQVCFDIASALHTSGSRGGAMFAKRRAKAQNWEVESVGTNPLVLESKVAERPKLISKLEQQHQQQQQAYRIQQAQQATLPQSVMQLNQMNPRPEPANMGPTPTTAPWPGNNQAAESIPISTPVAQPASKPKWRPVKFNIPQRAS